MSTARLRIGSYAEYDGEKLNLIRKLKDGIWQLECQKTKRIKEFSESEILGLISQKVMNIFERFPEEKTLKSDKRLALSANDEGYEIAIKRFEYVSATLNLPNTRSRLIPVIRETWIKLGRKGRAPDPATVIRWKNKYLDSGEASVSLLDRHLDKGNRRGRYCFEVEGLVSDAIEKVYLRRERGTESDVLDCAKHYVREENDLRGKLSQLKQPSMALVKRMIGDINAYDVCVARYGREYARKAFRSVIQNRITYSALERAEIDHTKLDLFVLNDKTGMPLGRPWLTICIDDFTRCVLGFSISFEPPSNLTVQRCLKQVFLPKTFLLKDYPDVDNEWAAHGVMSQLVVDNGVEFHSHALRNTCFKYGIEIHRAPRRTGWFKGKVERFFGTLNSDYIHKLPGTSFSNIFDRDDYDPKKHALTTYKELHECIYKWIVDVYHQREHKTIGMTPANMWKESVSQEDVRLISLPEELDVILGTPKKKTLTHKGIVHDLLYYNSIELNDLRYRYGDTCKVDILYNDDDLGEVIVFVKGDNHSYIVPAVSKEYAAGLTRWQHKKMKAWAKESDVVVNEAALLKAKVKLLKWAKTGKSSVEKARLIGDVNLLSDENDESDQKQSVTLLDDAKHIDEVVVGEAPSSFEAIKPLYRPRGDVLNKKEGS